MDVTPLTPFHSYDVYTELIIILPCTPFRMQARVLYNEQWDCQGMIIIKNKYALEEEGWCPPFSVNCPPFSFLRSRAKRSVGPMTALHGRFAILSNFVIVLISRNRILRTPPIF